MNYQNKYSKYKEKYIKLKNIQQLGGTMVTLTDWIEIPNNGQNNCGIYIHRTDPSLIMKCGAKLSDNVSIINTQASIFPKEYDEFIHKGEHYLVMERLDGDITSIYFNLIPLRILNSMDIDSITKEHIKIIFDIKTPATMKPIIPFDVQVNTLAMISQNQNITLELYNKFIDNLIIEWDKFHNIIKKEIVRVLLKLIDLGYSYEDMKFDNFGYKLSDVIIETDFRKENVPKLFGKYFYLYILDPDSGLFPLVYKDTLDDYFKSHHNYSFSSGEINETVLKFKKQIDLKTLEDIYKNGILIESIQDKYKKLLFWVNDGFNLSVHGQYSLSYINQIIKGEWNTSNNTYELPTFYTSEIIKILSTEYMFPIKKYNFKTLDELNKIRCPLCNKLLDPTCNFCCNCGNKLV